MSELDLSGAKKDGENGESEEVNFANVIANALANISDSLLGIEAHTGRIANVLERQLEIDEADLEDVDDTDPPSTETNKPE